MKNSQNTELTYLLSCTAIRERAQKIFQLAVDGKTNFKIDLNKVEKTADFVIKVINKNYPDLNIPFHSRWGHFQVGQIDRLSEFDQLIRDNDPIEIARIKIDLAITSVLLDAGAGPTWKYLEGSSQKTFNRSEGLAIASYYMFIDGKFSSVKSRPLQAEAKKLQQITPESIINSFQVNDTNPLVGIEGRATLLQKLGEVLSKKSDFFKDSRPGNIIDYLIEKHGNEFEANDILQAVLNGFGEIWPGRINYAGSNLGDVWNYPPFGAEKNSFKNLVPIHKLSQWLTYSLIEPMLEAGLKITGVEKLTGLAEYRNGGLLVDMGVLVPRSKKELELKHLPSSEFIIEWRALTIILLDKIADIVQSKLERSPQDFPLAKILEGGTWWAGRIIAKEKREDGSPPIKLESDGTVF